ncbi:protein TRIGALACTOSYLDIACYLGLYCEROL 2, chloroplastic-like [Olea europaea var. sylvestris]|uniref:protein TRIGALACTOSYLDIACYLGLYCEROL 2, chloroplastic-like n=1 Tax=Olea europaea var. sylvestris TaxID=158386 RepID=UPI000C1D7F5C|nr:protein TRIGALACTOSYLDIACYLGLYCEROL 2, chloroplastic-like [Olea europaea var. sylvestris]
METTIDITPRNPILTPSVSPLDADCVKEGLIVCDKQKIKGYQWVSLDELVGIFTRIGREVEEIGVAKTYSLAERVSSVVEEARPLLIKYKFNFVFIVNHCQIPTSLYCTLLGKIHKFLRKSVWQLAGNGTCVNNMIIAMENLMMKKFIYDKVTFLGIGVSVKLLDPCFCPPTAYDLDFICLYLDAICH